MVQEKVKETKFNLYPKQAEFLFGIPEEKFHLVDKEGNKKFHIDISCYQGGYGSGKTYCGALRGIFLALRYPGIKGFVGASTQDLIDNTTKVQYVDHLTNMGFEEGLHFWFEDRKTKLCFINGSLIYFKTTSDPEQYRSYNLGFVEFEEGSLISENAFDVLLSRLRQAKRPEWDNHFCYNFFIHTNPGGMRGWIYRNFINPKTKKKGYRYVTASTRENKSLHAAYVEMLEEKYSKEQIQELIEGVDVDRDDTIAFPDFNELNIRDNLTINRKEPLILTCDFNFNPMCWYLVQYYNGVWVVLREMVVNSITTQEMCKVAQTYIDKFGVRTFKLMGDSHGKDQKTNGSDYGIMMAYFQNKGYNVELRIANSNPLIKERLALLRGLICNAKGQRRLFVDSSCKKLIYNFDEGRNNLANGGMKSPTDMEIQKDPELKYMVHPIDAISYPMWYLDRYGFIT